MGSQEEPYYYLAHYTLSHGGSVRILHGPETVSITKSDVSLISAKAKKGSIEHIESEDYSSARGTATVL